MGVASEVVIAGRRLLCWMLAAFACVTIMMAAVSLAFADESSGYVSVVGVVGLDESTAFSSVPEAMAAVASCDAAAQAADPAGAALVIHGAVTVDAQAATDGLFNLCYPVDGSAYAIVGADASASLTFTDSSGAGRTPVLSNEGGSLVVRGVSVDGPLGLSCRDDLVIDGSTFNAPLSCSAGGSITAAGNIFASSWAAPAAALYAELRGAEGTLAFSGNRVSGYAAGISARAQQGGAGLGLSVTSNTFVLDPAAAGYDGGSSYVVCLSGGPWVPSSVACDGNSVEGALAFFVLDGSCTVGVWSNGSLGVESVAEGTLESSAVVSLFELAGLGSAPMADFSAVAVVPAFAGTEVAAQVAAASAALIPSEVPVEDVQVTLMPATVTVTYDGNGASAGEAPEPVSVDSGQPVTVAHMGSLICAGCLFSGWNTAPDGSGVFYAAGQVIWPEGDTVLYAQWTPNGTVGTVAVTEQQYEERAE